MKDWELTYFSFMSTVSVCILLIVLVLHCLGFPK
jgi:hypothetical protein